MLKICKAKLWLISGRSIVVVISCLAQNRLAASFLAALSMLNHSLKFWFKINELINLFFTYSFYSKTPLRLENWPTSNEKFRPDHSSSTNRLWFWTRSSLGNDPLSTTSLCSLKINSLPNEIIATPLSAPRRRLVKAVNECKTQATIAKKFKSKFVGQIEKKKWLKNRSSKGELEESKLNKFVEQFVKQFPMLVHWTKSRLYDSGSISPGLWTLICCWDLIRERERMSPFLRKVHRLFLKRLWAIFWTIRLDGESCSHTKFSVWMRWSSSLLIEEIEF